MAISGSYRINFTDPKNGSFVIEPYTVNGNITPTSDVLHAKATRANTSLQLPGQYVPNYGELVHEDLVHLLENFAGDKAPTVPIEGQLWYDTGDSYTIVDLSANQVVVSGNYSAAFGTYITNGTILSAWYGPVSTTDNSYNEIQFKATSALVSAQNNTVITITKPDGTALTLPNSSVGGYITPTSSSRLGRLKIATKVAGAVTWANVVNVQVSPTAPNTEYVATGDLWYDQVNSQFKMYLNGTWIVLTGGYLQLTGGTMSGPIVMGNYPITFTGTVSSGTTLTNKTYVDTAITTATTPIQTQLDNTTSALTGRIVTLETTMPQKVSKAGDNISGALVFGPNGSTTTLTNGIDMQNKAIINPLITWSAADYLVAAGETHNVVDKSYVAQALVQHLADAVHGGKSFIVEQPDGTGKITDSLFFDNATKSLTWNILGNTAGLGINSSTLMLYVNDAVGSGVDIRTQNSDPVTTNPIFRISSLGSRSFSSLYIHDGQPQPTAGGGVNDQNDDTKAATKGFVTDAINGLSLGLAPVTGATFTYNLNDIQWPFTIQRSGASDIVVDINHQHNADRIIHTYVPMDNWIGGTTDLVGLMLGMQPTVPVSSMLTALNEQKAPISGAKFGDFPTVGYTDILKDINLTDNSFALANTSYTIQIGFRVNMTEADGTPHEYLVTGSEERLDPYDDMSTYYFVDGVLPTVDDLTKDNVTITWGAYANASGAELLNRATVEYEIAQYVEAQLRTVMVTVGDETTPLTAGTSKHTFRMPHGMTLTDIKMSLTTAQATGSIVTVDVNLGGTSILSTKLTIDNTEKTSRSAAVPPVISTSVLPEDGEITIDIDQVDAATTAAGLKLVLLGHYKA